MSETTQVVKPILEFLDANGFMAWKNHGNAFTKRGVSDIIAVRDGRVYFFECKMPGQQATKLQEKFIRDVRAKGAIAGIVDCVDDVVKLLRGVK